MLKKKVSNYFGNVLAYSANVVAVSIESSSSQSQAKHLFCSVFIGFYHVYQRKYKQSLYTPSFVQGMSFKLLIE